MLNFRKDAMLPSESRIRRRAGVLASGCLVILALTSPAMASAAEAEAEIRIPTLNGHQFTPNGLTSDPFILTYIRNSIGIGEAVDVFVPVLEIDGDEVLGLKGDLMNAILEFEYQQAVKDWIAFRAQIRIYGRLGTGIQSILAQGITANMGFEFGWMFKLAQGEKTALSGTLNAWNNSTTAVDLLGFVNGAVDGNNVPLVKTVPVARGGVGLRYAWAATELTGFNFLVDTGLGESPDRSLGDEWFFKFAAAADFDLKKKTVLPLGVVLAYRTNRFPDTGESARTANHDFLLRIAYTGTTDFLVSIDISYSLIQSGGKNEDYEVTSTLLNMRYYF